MKPTNFLSPVQELIMEVETRMRAQANDHYPDLNAAIEHLLSSGGKRVRPAVALLTGGMLNGDPKHLVTLAAAIELLHTATLVHDDLIDGSLLRRGIPTINANWSPAATVLTGDFIFAQAAKLAAETESVAVMRKFSETLAVIVSGELTQLFKSRGRASREDYFERIYAKTASMFELASGAAAELSPVDEETILKANRFGYAIGMAFQIVDDVLDFTGQQSDIGKPVATDLRQGLITLPALIYLEKYSDDPDFLSITNGDRANPERLNRLVQNIRSSGAIQEAMQEAEQFVLEGLQNLEDLPDGMEKQALKDLADYIVQRQI